ncbi:hypothetical protein HY633_02400 [Candidatus Uhrbacteria bacterium]|nr:hypothetical protein [Candidatus Uhrbacteria bacterium]
MGQCAICHRPGSSKHFICEDCGDPEAVVVYCSGCRRHARGGPDILGIIELVTRQTIPRRIGTSVKLSCCTACFKPGMTFSTTIYHLRSQHLLLH